MKRQLKHILCLDDFEHEARKILPRRIFAYWSGAVETNASLQDNRRSFAEYGFIPRVLRNVAQIDTSTTLLGQTFDVPFGIAPMGISAIAAYRGDCVLAAAAQAGNFPMIMSGSSLIRMEEVAEIGKNVWFQAYLPGDEAQIAALIARISNAGFNTLVITVDTPVAANRENNVRAGFSTPLRPSPGLLWDGITHPAWSVGVFARTLLRHGIPHFENNYATRGAPVIAANVMRDFSDRGHVSWQYLRKVRQQWNGKLIIKGVLSIDDARMAVDHGVDGIIVSNHGGRQLDGAVSPLRILPRIVEACPDGFPVMMDSGVRRGSDVLKALALGARFVFVGRPFGYAAVVDGQQGVAHAADLLKAEIRRNMAMLGVTQLNDLSAEYLLLRHIPAADF